MRCYILVICFSLFISPSLTDWGGTAAGVGLAAPYGRDACLAHVAEGASFNLHPRDTCALKAGSSHEDGHTVEGKRPERCGVSARAGLQDVPAAQLPPSAGVNGFTDSCRASTEEMTAIHADRNSFAIC